MKNVLYISDIDGTLTNSNNVISRFTVDSINELISKGVYFTVATARSPITAVEVVEGINFNIPILTMNGSFIYNTQKKKVIKKFTLSQTAKSQIFNLFDAYGLHGFAFSEQNSLIYTNFAPINNPQSQEFYDTRKDLNTRIFVPYPSHSSLVEQDISFIAVVNTLDYVERVYALIANIPDITVSYYKDHLNPELYFLEISAIDCSKGQAGLWLKQHLGLDEITAFGDNLNDLELFKYSNTAYAVRNAHDKVKQNCSQIIDYCYNDAVAKKILEINKGVR